MPDPKGFDLERYGAIGLFLLAVVILFVQLGSYPLQMQWEPNYGQVVREMVWGEGDSITPASRVGNDEGAAPGTFWSKPILIFWMAYPFYAAFGDGEWSARLPIALVGLFGVMMTYWLMARLFNRRTGLIAGFVLLTTPVYFLICRAYMVDAPFVVFLWVAVGFLLLGEKEGHTRWYLLFYVFMGLSALAKGLTPLILVGGALGAYLLVTLDWRLLVRMLPLRGGLVFLGVAAPWYVYMSARYDHWLSYFSALLSGGENPSRHIPYVTKFFWDHHFERAMGRLDKPNDTFEMFVLYFAIGMLPWLAFLPQALAGVFTRRRHDADAPRPELFFLCAFLMIFAFFSAISTKFPHYIFPAVPFAAMLIAVQLGRFVDRENPEPISRIGLLAGLLVFGVVAPDLLDAKNYRTLFYFITTERLQNWHPPVADPSGAFRLIFLLYGVGLAGMLLMRRINLALFAPLLLAALLYALYINGWMIPKLTEMFSARSMVQTYLTMRQSPDEPLGEFTQTWKSRSIKYYIPFDELKDRYDYRRYRIFNNESSVRAFHQRYKGQRVFIIIEQKKKHFSRLNALWQDVSGGEQLVRLATDEVPGEPYRPEFWLVSNRDASGKTKRVDRETRKRQIDDFVSTEAPTPQVVVNAPFDPQVLLVGWDSLPETIPAGTGLTVTLYFKATERPLRDYRVFVHAERGREFRLRGDHVPVEGLYPVNRWQAGEYIRDVYTLDIPAHVEPGPLEVLVGLFDGDYRPRIAEIPQRMQDNRIRLGEVTVIRKP